MRYSLTPLGQRVLNLVRSVRQLGSILPGEKVKVLGEKPATYLGAVEIGEFPTEYIQMHIFRLWDGLPVILEAPTLNRILGKYLF
jgi:hypothetical protein